MIDMSDTPAGIIARLDAALVRRGTTVQLRKANSAAGQVSVLAHWRAYKPTEIAGIIMAGDTKVVVSPTGLEAFGIPPSNGYVVINGAPHRIILPTPIFDRGVLVRIDLQVRGS